MEFLETHRREHETASLGMWMFLATEIMLFGAIFTSYSAFWVVYTEEFQKLSKHMLIEVAGPNTAVLMTSSLTMGLAVVWGRAGKLRATWLALVATAALGLVFLGLKFYEWHHEYTHHMLPLGWRDFAFEKSHLPGARIFMSLYLIGTAFHFLHLTIGVGLVGVETLRVVKGGWRQSSEMIGLYWHLVDVIWMFLFAIFYMVR